MEQPGIVAGAQVARTQPVAMMAARLVVVVSCVAICVTVMLALLRDDWDAETAVALWCSGEPRDERTPCASFSAEIQRRPWSRERVLRLCDSLPRHGTECRTYWALYHTHLDWKHRTAYFLAALGVLSILSILSAASAADESRDKAPPLAAEDESATADSRV